jgi:hypothetical protein
MSPTEERRDPDWPFDARVEALKATRGADTDRGGRGWRRFARVASEPGELRQQAAEREKAEQREQRVTTRIAELKGHTPLEQELIDALRALLALPKTVDFSAIREIARAAYADVDARKLRERLLAAALLTVALDISDDTLERATAARRFLRERLYLIADGTVKLIRTEAERLERRVAPDPRSTDGIFGLAAFWWAMKLAGSHRFAVPASRHSELHVQWRIYWRAMYASRGDSVLIAPRDRSWPAPPAIAYAGSGSEARA